jgi:hypothetical protein
LPAGADFVAGFMAGTPFEGDPAAGDRAAEWFPASLAPEAEVALEGATLSVLERDFLLRYKLKPTTSVISNATLVKTKGTFPKREVTQLKV